MVKDNNRIGWEDAITQIMAYKKISRNEATAQLVEKLREGKIHAWGSRSDLDTDEKLPIPPEAWPKIN